MTIIDLIIIGGGPAGLSAALYGKRNGLSTLVIEKGVCGGLMTEAPLVENYLGFISISGMDLAQKFKQHALAYSDIIELKEVTSVTKKENTFVVHTGGEEHQARSIILATGARHAQLGVEGEETYRGRGVSYCATCDGFFYRNRSAMVVGGGNSAVIDAIHLHDLGCHVTLIHRRNELRAEKTLKNALEKREIPILWNSVLEKINGDGDVNGAIVKDVKNGEKTNVPVEGVFISVGEIPNNELAKELGMELDGRGFIKTDKGQRTNIPRAYAAGDITGGVKQIIVGCSEGAISAISAFEDIIDPYWKK